MDEYIWDTRADYLKRSRQDMWNSDYMQFLVERVWRVESPVDIVDFGCGLGFMGAMLLPLLPKGSTYTGLDKGKALLEEAKKIFLNSPYDVTFVETDLLTYKPQKKYDIAVCHAVLQHIPGCIGVMEKMRDSVVHGGKVICMECDRNMANAALYFDGVDLNRMNNLGILQKLWLSDLDKEGSDHTIGMKIPAYMQKIGLKDIGVRLSDCVNFINAEGDKQAYKTHYDSFISGGWGDINKDREQFVRSLISRGLTREEAEYQFGCEMALNEYVSQNKDSACIVTALCQIISFGTV